MKPFIGADLWYWQAGPRAADDQPQAGTIVHLNDDGTVRLAVWNHHGDPYPIHCCPLLQDGEEPPSPNHYCEWPANVREAAAKAARETTEKAARVNKQKPAETYAAHA